MKKIAFTAFIASILAVNTESHAVKTSIVQRDTQQAQIDQKIKAAGLAVTSESRTQAAAVTAAGGGAEITKSTLVMQDKGVGNIALAADRAAVDAILAWGTAADVTLANINAVKYLQAGGNNLTAAIPAPSKAMMEGLLFLQNEGGLGGVAGGAAAFNGAGGGVANPQTVQIEAMAHLRGTLADNDPSQNDFITTTSFFTDNGAGSPRYITPTHAEIDAVEEIFAAAHGMVNANNFAVLAENYIKLYHAIPTIAYSLAAQRNGREVFRILHDVGNIPGGGVARLFDNGGAGGNFDMEVGTVLARAIAEDPVAFTGVENGANPTDINLTQPLQLP
tara:strand:+ start:932 stop:1933 length:1002 start_codon:yes stop_codon:yes gene_type:complete